MVDVPNVYSDSKVAPRFENRILLDAFHNYFKPTYCCWQQSSRSVVYVAICGTRICGDNFSSLHRCFARMLVVYFCKSHRNIYYSIQSQHSWTSCACSTLTLELGSGVCQRVVTQRATSKRTIGTFVHRATHGEPESQPLYE